MSGFGFWSHDIGGFESTSTADVYKRWCAFGLLSSHSRLHGSTSYRVPWNYDEEAVEVLRFFTKLKMSLMPYLYQAAVTAHKEGIPVMRSMVLEFETDMMCQYLDKQYMLGENLLVSPIFNEEGIGKYYLPEGVWTNYLTGKKRIGGKWYSEKYGYCEIPLWVRPNSIIPVKTEDMVPEYDAIKNIVFKIYSLEEEKEAKATVYDMNAVESVKIAAVKNGNKITITLVGNSGDYSVELNGYKVKTVSGAKLSQKEDKAVLTDCRLVMEIELE